MNQLGQVEQKTRAYAIARKELTECVADLQEQLAKLQEARMFKVRRLADKVAERHADLRTAIEASSGSFKRPRTRVFFGVKVGMKKAVGGLKWANKERVVQLIRKHYPERFSLLVKVEESPLRKPLSQLTAAELKKLSVTVVESGDVVVIAPADSETDKLVAALLAAASEREEAKS